MFKSTNRSDTRRIHRIKDHEKSANLHDRPILAGTNANPSNVAKVAGTTAGKTNTSISTSKKPRAVTNTTPTPAKGS